MWTYSPDKDEAVTKADSRGGTAGGAAVGGRRAGEEVDTERGR